MKLKLGQAVKTIGFFEGIEGIVMNISPGYSADDHGRIAIKVTKITRPEKFLWLSLGELEHFTYFGHEKILCAVE